MRAMLLEFPEDPACETLDRQYMLGSSLLVAPVFSEDGDVQFYLPEGLWTHVLSGEIVEGGRWFKEQHGFMSLPLYARPNSLIPWGNCDDRPDYDYADGVEFALHALDDGAEASAAVCDLSGAERLRLTVRSEAHALVVKPSSDALVWRLRIPGENEISVSEGTVLSVDQTSGTIVQARGTVRIAW